MTTITAPMRLHSGKLIDLANPDPDAITLEDIAWHLAGINRWTGASRYTDAQHCVLVYLLSGYEPWALLHDAHEAYVGDMSYPLKSLIGDAYRRWERPWMHAVSARFGVPIVAVSAADELAADIEAETMWPGSRPDLPAIVRQMWVPLPEMPPAEAADLWLRAAAKMGLK